MAEHFLPLARDRAAEVLVPARAVEAVPPQRLHHACQQLLRLSLAPLEPIATSYAVPSVTRAPIEAEDVAWVACQCRDLSCGYIVGPLEIVGCGVVAVGAAVDATLVEDDVRLGQETHECLMAGWVARQGRRAICVRSDGAPVRHRRSGGHGEQPSTSVLHHVPLVVRVADLVEGTAVAPASGNLGPPHRIAVCLWIRTCLGLRVRPCNLGLSPTPLGGLESDELLGCGLQRIVVRRDLGEDLGALSLLVEEGRHKVDPLGAVQGSGVHRDHELDVPARVRESSAEGVREHHRAVPWRHGIVVGLELSAPTCHVDPRLTLFHQLRAWRGNVRHVDAIDELRHPQHFEEGQGTAPRKRCPLDGNFEEAGIG
mmetsp:Transcript_1703/g.5527  ORF Transcript_1703/g.5527 Transcript_1703/m.5527 type:complete len:370 (+) Transcript_1703:384-1493(+)